VAGERFGRQAQQTGPIPRRPVLQHGQHQDGNLGVGGGDLAACFNAVDVRHGDVNQDDVGRGRSGHLDGLLGSGGLTGHVDVGPVSEQGAQPAR
jgi:hypothetical protein